MLLALYPFAGRVYECMLRYPPFEWTRQLRLWTGPIEWPERQGV